MKRWTPVGADYPVEGADQGKRSRGRPTLFPTLYRLMAMLAYLAVRSGHSKDLEIIVIRYQVMVLRRQINRPAINDDDRSLLGAIAAALPRQRRVGWIVTPDTLLRANSNAWPSTTSRTATPTDPTAREQAVKSPGSWSSPSREITRCGGLINKYRNAA